MSLSMSQARGTGPSTFKPYSNNTKSVSKPDKQKAQVKCKPGYVELNGRCMPQEQRNKKANIQSTQNNNTINKSNERFYRV